jgi:predicted nucleic acid-binding Zn ribbon protein
MAKKKTTPRRDWRMMFFLVLSVLIVLSMVLAFIIPAFNY